MNTNTSSQKIIQEMVRRIVDQMGPEKIILFGSYARGTPGPDSDVDLMVVFSSVKSRRRKAAEIYGLLGGVGLPKDIVVVTSKDIEQYRNIVGTIIKPALDEGRVIYDRAA